VSCLSLVYGCFAAFYYGSRLSRIPEHPGIPDTRMIRGSWETFAKKLQGQGRARVSLEALLNPTPGMEALLEEGQAPGHQGISWNCIVDEVV
jgi:hypothetical protein